MPAVGVVLAGGRGSRMGGEKATVLLDGVSLLDHVLRALGEVLARRAVVVKAGTVLPALPTGVERWDEPDEPRHPLTGVVHALRCAGGDAVLCCAVDLPRLDARTLRALLEAPATAPCVVAEADGRLQPLCALWRPAALTTLERVPAEGRMHDVLAALGAARVAVDARALVNVNSPADLAVLADRRRNGQ